MQIQESAVYNTQEICAFCETPPYFEMKGFLQVSYNCTFLYVNLFVKPRHIFQNLNFFCKISDTKFKTHNSEAFPGAILPNTFWAFALRFCLSVLY